jgi:(S)-ureidoglycine aminohydrolase
MQFLYISLLHLLVFTASAQQDLKPIPSGVYRWAEHPVKTGATGEGRKILEGTSPHFEYLEMHATTQFPGAVPRDLHASADLEECIIVKAGTMKVTIDGESKVLGAGGVVLVMPQQMHTIQNVGDDNLTYYMMRYRSKNPVNIERGILGGGSMMLNTDSLVYKPSADGRKAGKAYFDRATSMCERFEMHITYLNQKGPSHAPHQHIETEIILIISGEMEMTIDGNKYAGGAGDFYFANSQEMHGIANATDNPCSYFAFKWK